MLKVLFLDIDGVLLNEQDYRTNGSRVIPQERVDLIKQACDRTGAVIVVSSTWRYSDETRDRLTMMGLSLHPDWRTIRSRVEGALIMAEIRGDEIKQWLDAHPEVASFAIVDDDSDMRPEQMSRFVQTQFSTGVTPAHVERLVAILQPHAAVEGE